MEKITAFLRVESGAIKPFTFRACCNPAVEGEAMEFRSTGVWSDEREYPDSYPASLHVTLPIGVGVMPVTGDFVKITIERATAEEMSAENDRRFRSRAGRF